MIPFIKYLTDESKTLIQFYDGIIKKNKPLFDKIDKIVNHENHENHDNHASDTKCGAEEPKKPKPVSSTAQKAII
jgi:hypothetical protein